MGRSNAKREFELSMQEGRVPISSFSLFDRSPANNNVLYRSLPELQALDGPWRLVEILALRSSEAINRRERLPSYEVRFVFNGRTGGLFLIEITCCVLTVAASEDETALSTRKITGQLSKSAAFSGGPMIFMPHFRLSASICLLSGGPFRLKSRTYSAKKATSLRTEASASPRMRSTSNGAVSLGRVKEGHAMLMRRAHHFDYVGAVWDGRIERAGEILTTKSYAGNL